MTKYVAASDGVNIAYTAAGNGQPELMFIHGGLADRSVWGNQLDAFSRRCKVVALDLAGHGESGCNRAELGIQAFGGDVLAVLEAEGATHAVLVGNSLGGPVAVEAALLAPNRVKAIVAVDTFHDLNQRIPTSESNARAQEFKTDFAGSVRKLVSALFHPDANPGLMRTVEQGLSTTSPETASKMFLSFAGYEMSASVRRLKVPVHCINGDLFPMDIAANRQVYADFHVVVLPHTGHYPMLECPEEFNRRLSAILDQLGSVPV